MRTGSESARRRKQSAVMALLYLKSLLDYAETYHLTKLIEKNWDKFQPVLKDKARTLTYFGVIEDVRNSVAHSRDLVPFERDLISGIAGHMRNQVALFRSGNNQSAKYYPLIESIKDNFGIEGLNSRLDYMVVDTASTRLDVGSVLTFDGRAFNAKGRPVTWQLAPSSPSTINGSCLNVADVAKGDSVTFDYAITEANVSEHLIITIQIVADSRYHRHGYIDDTRKFHYAVNPPDEA